MTQRSGAQISQKAFIQSFLILLVLMAAAGVLTRVLPAGSYTRTVVEGRTVIDPRSYHPVDSAPYPVWRWIIAPFEQLAGPDGVTVVVICLFLLMVGAAFAVLDGSGILRAVIATIVARSRGHKYLLLAVITLFFMLLGAFFGIFEEVIPLVPIMIALSIYLGWDSLLGLGMSILAVNMGFSAAVTNPFTIGVAQRLAGLPLFSGAALRLVIFIAVYLVLIGFLLAYARKVEQNPAVSPVYQEDQAYLVLHPRFDLQAELQHDVQLRRSLSWFGIFIIMIMLALVAAPFVPALSDYSLPIVAVLFLAGGLGAGFLSGKPGRLVWRSAGDGLLGIAPGILLILMAASIRHIVVTGGILDTLLYQVSGLLRQATAFGSSLVVYALALVIEFFIGSGSAKAFLLMPVLLPLADLAGLTRQVAVTAYCFGDGFSNLVYPTNPVLLIALGLTVVSYAKWLRWTLKLWLMVLPLTVLLLWLAVALHFGPF